MRTFPRIAEDYRVYLILSPKVRLVAGSDSALAVADELDEIAASLEAAIAAKAAAGYDVTVAERELASVEEAAAIARTEAGSVADAVLNLEPSDWSSAEGSIENARTAMRTAHTNIRAARQHAKAAVSALRG